MLIGLGARGANTTSAWETGGHPRFKSPVTRTQRAPLRRGHRHHALADSNALHARPACLHHSQACKGKGSGATSGCTLQSAGWRHLLVMGTLTFLWLANEDVAALVTLATSPKGGRSCQLPKALGACLLTQRADKPQGSSEADRCGVHQTFSAGRQRQLWSPHAPLN